MKFVDLLRHRLDEIDNTEIKEVTWEKNIGHFNIEEENYEIVFENADESSNENISIRGVKFYRILNNQRMLSYIDSKEPLVVTQTLFTEVKKYLEIEKPDIFVYSSSLDKKTRLLYYFYVLKNLRYEFPKYKDIATEDDGPERFFILATTLFQSNTNLKIIKSKIGPIFSYK